VQIYAAFNSNGVSVLVSDADLDDAARYSTPLSTEIADAAGQALRTDLIENLRASLDGDDRARKLAAAKALLALADRGAGALLESHADAETDAVVAKSFLAVATRLRGTDSVVDLFSNPNTDPQLARLLVSNYNSHLRPDIGDVQFLIGALQRYVDRSLPWLAKLPADLWHNGVYLMLNALSNEHAVSLLRAHPSERSMLLRLLFQLADHTDDDDILEQAHSLRAALPAQN
jgi:hypothetical protein